MPHHGEWLIPLRVVQVRMWGVVTETELEGYSELGVQFLSEARAHDPKRLVYLLLDVTEVESFPLPYLMIPRALPVLRFRNRGPVFFVTRNQSLKNILHLTAHIMRFSHRTFSTREEAIQAIKTTLGRDELKGQPDVLSR